jgi:hypothetical protein
MWLLMLLFGFSERQDCDEVRMHAGYRWFCGLSFNDSVPDQSTLVKLRREKWAGTGLWEKALRATASACEASGLSFPGLMALDGTQVRANAQVERGLGRVARRRRKRPRNALSNH